MTEPEIRRAPAEWALSASLDQLYLTHTIADNKFLIWLLLIHRGRAKGCRGYNLLRNCAVMWACKAEPLLVCIVVQHKQISCLLYLSFRCEQRHYIPPNKPSVWLGLRQFCWLLHWSARLINPCVLMITQSHLYCIVRFSFPLQQRQKRRVNILSVNIPCEPAARAESGD